MSVNKSNELIQKASYKLSSIEAKILDKVISMINPQAEKFNHFYELNLNDFVENDLNIKEKYTNYTKLKRIVKKMRQKGFTIITDKTDNEITELYTSWFANVETKSNSNTVIVEVSEAMKPYYFALNKNYTSYNANFIYKLKNKYSIRLYELLSSHKNQRKKKGTNYVEVKYKLSELKKLFNIVNMYNRFDHFKLRVLNTAKKELKDKDTDIQFDYETRGRGAGKDIIFKIYNVKEAREKQEAEKKQELINNSDNIDKQIYTDIEKELKKYKINQKTINQLISSYDEMQIRRNIEYAVKRNQEAEKKNLSGYIINCIKEDFAMKTYEERQEYKKQQQEKKAIKQGKSLPIEPKVDKMEEKVKEIANNNDLNQQLLKFLVVMGTPKAMKLMTAIITNGILQAYQEERPLFNLVDKFWNIRNQK